MCNDIHGPFISMSCLNTQVDLAIPGRQSHLATQWVRVVGPLRLMLLVLDIAAHADRSP